MDHILARERAGKEALHVIMEAVGWNVRSIYACYFALPSLDKASRVWELLHYIWLQEYVLPLYLAQFRLTHLFA
jgi:hypothetical protein